MSVGAAIATSQPIGGRVHARGLPSNDPFASMWGSRVTRARSWVDRLPDRRAAGVGSRAGAGLHLHGDRPRVLGIRHHDRGWDQRQRGDHRRVLFGNRGPDKVPDPEAQATVFHPSRPRVPVEQRNDDRPRHAWRPRLERQCGQRPRRGGRHEQYRQRWLERVCESERGHDRDRSRRRHRGQRLRRDRRRRSLPSRRIAWGDLAILAVWGLAGLAVALRRFRWMPAAAGA